MNGIEKGNESGGKEIDQNTNKENTFLLEKEE